MNRQEFIQKIIELYPDTFKADRVEHIQAWVEMYEKAMRRNWDYDKLMVYFATEYKSTVTPPPPSFFYQFRNDVRIEVEVPLRIEPPTPEELEEIEKARQKFFESFEKFKERSTING